MSTKKCSERARKMVGFLARNAILVSIWIIALPFLAWRMKSYQPQEDPDVGWR